MFSVLAGTEGMNPTKEGGEATAGVDGLLLSALHCGSGEWSSSPKEDRDGTGPKDSQ